MTRAVIFLMVFLPFSATALTQVVHISVGSFSGELHCPDQNRSAPSGSRGRQEDVFEPPRNEELAGLPIRGEVYSQEIFLGERRTDPSLPFSIGLWGDSHAASNYFSEELVRALGFTRDMVHPAFIPPTMDRSGVRLPIRKHCQSTGWSYEFAYTSGQANANFAKGLANLKSNVPNSYLWIDFRWQPQTPGLRSLDVLYVPPIQGERTLVGIIADDGAEQIVELKAGEGQGVMHLHADQTISTIKLRLVEGTFVLQGLVPQYVEKPALYLDTFGIPGATVRGWKTLNTEYFKKRDNSISYDLVILEYGTNEGNDQNFDLERYSADLRASLKNLRQVYPESMCVLIGPTDRGVLVRRSSPHEHQYTIPPKKSFLYYSQIHQRIGELQAAISREYSCSFWSWQNAMGGPGGAYLWQQHSPALMAKDLTHLTVSGYQLSAGKFVADTKLANYMNNRPD